MENDSEKTVYTDLPSQPQNESENISDTNQVLKAPKKKFWPIAGLTMLILFLLGTIGYLIYQNYQLKQLQIEPDQVIPTPTLTSSSLITDLTTNWEIYKNEDYNFELKYPTDWGISVSSQNNSLYIAPKATLEQISEKPGAYGKEALPIVIEFNQPLDLKIIPDKSKVIDQKDIRLANIDAVEYLLEIIELEMGFNIGDQYTKIALKTADNYLAFSLFDDQYKIIFNQIFSTFKFTDSRPSPIINPTVDWETYANDKYKATFKYPKSWNFFSEPSENYNNPNKGNGYADECLVNFNQVFLMQDNVNTPWGSLSAYFDLQISVTNPNKWTLEEWVNKCRSYLETDNAEYTRKVVAINDRKAILFYKEGQPGNGGEATHYIYTIEAGNKFYSFSFGNHKYLDEGENTIDTLLKTINFL